MAYFGCQFVFDDIPSWEYGLVIYDLGGANEDGDFTTPAEIVEDRINNRYTPLHYGVKRNEPLKFQLHFGVDPRAVDKREWLDRWEIDAIASWLTEHNDYKYLEIFQQDLDTIRYKCIITDLTYSSYGKYPWAFTCEVTCDSPYAYLYPESHIISLTSTSGATSAGKIERIRCLASPKYYRPKLKITTSNVQSISIINNSDGGRELSLTNLPGGSMTLSIDNENEILSKLDNNGAIDTSLNLYDKFNMKYFRFVRGINEIYLSATRKNSTVFSVAAEFLCEFPINVGG